MALDLIGQLFVDGVWTTYKGLEGAGWAVTIGPDVETGTRPNKLEFRFDNDTRQMDPYNPSGALFGKIGRNTRARIRINSTTLTQAEASDWVPDETQEFVSGASLGLSWTDLTGEGLLRRLGRWTDPIDSPMTRQIGSYTSSLGYWPLEDPSGAALLEQQSAGAGPGHYTGTVTLQGDNGPGGSDKTVTIGSDGRLFGYFRGTSGNGYQLCWTAKLAAVPSSATFLPILSWADSLGRTWQWQVNNTQMGWQVNDADGTLLASLAAGYGAATPNQWIRYRMKVTVSAGTVTYEPAWYVQDASVIVGTSGTFSAASTGRPRRWDAAGNAWTSSAAYGHVVAVTDTSLDLTGGYAAVASFNGYLNEKATDRFLRLLGEQSLGGYLIGSAAAAVPMGRQKPGILLDLLTECVVTDGGLLYDEPADIALSFRTRIDMLNRTPALALTKGVDVAYPLKRRTDDVGVVNSVTITNADGSKAVAELAAGALSVAAPPAGVGRYKGGIDVNMANTDALADRAEYELNKGTVDRPRYDEVTVDLLANPGYANTVTNMRPGDWISITGAEPDTVYLRVISWKRKGDAVRDTVTFNCLPADLFQVLKSDTAGHLAGSSSTTLGAGATSTATTLTLSTTILKDVWSVAGNYDLTVAGERIGVPAGGMSAASGTGPYTQTVTGAVRSKNGVVKAQLSGAAVQIFQPKRFGL
jgi:hypothetical protein